MSWKEPFNQGISSFQASSLGDALVHFNRALAEEGGDKQYIIYDSRAAIYEKLQKSRDALRDAKAVITLAPDRWQGYCRAARLFLLARKFDASLTMADMALERMKPHNTKRRVEMEKIREDALHAQRVDQDHRRLIQNHMGKLPIELFGEVFCLVVEWDPVALITLLHICHHWRTIALHTPSLWETLVLTQHGPVRKLRLWTTQSKNNIRSLQIRAGAVRHLDWPFRELENISWHKLRVCKVDLWDVAKYLEKLSSHYVNHFAHLEELVIGEGLDTPPSPSLYPLLQTSRIRSLAVIQAGFSWKLASIHLQNLVILRIIGRCLEMGYVLPTLQANSSLETLIMSTQIVYKWPPPSESSLVLPHLTRIELAGSWASSLLEVIAMPALEILQVRGAGGSLDDALTDAATRSLNLKQLDLDHCSITPSVLISFIQRTPCLTSLALISLSTVANSLADALAKISSSSQITSEDDVLCPALTHLNLSHSPDLQTGPLVRLIKSRLPSANPPGPLKCSELLSLTVDGCDQIDPDWVPWMRKNIQVVSCIYQTKKASWKR